MVATWKDEDYKIAESHRRKAIALYTGIIVLCSLFWLMLFRGCALADNGIDANRIADKIYILEGGKNTKYPYGIRSVKAKNTLEARKICIRTINHKYQQWFASGHRGEFLDYLADKYCPKSADLTGNINWHKNIHRLMRA
jgi:hypothetical protein